MIVVVFLVSFLTPFALRTRAASLPPFWDHHLTTTNCEPSPGPNTWFYNGMYLKITPATTGVVIVVATLNTVLLNYQSGEYTMYLTTSGAKSCNTFVSGETQVGLIVQRTLPSNPSPYADLTAIPLTAKLVLSVGTTYYVNVAMNALTAQNGSPSIFGIVGGSVFAEEQALD